MAWRDQDFSRNRWARDENDLGAINSRLNRGGFSLTESAITGDTGEVNPIGLSPFIRENDINFAARNLKPEASANLFFDATPVNRFAQRASAVNVTSTSVLTSVKIMKAFMQQHHVLMQKF